MTPQKIPYTQFIALLQDQTGWNQELDTQIWRGRPGENHTGFVTLVSRSKTTRLRITHVDKIHYDPSESPVHIHVNQGGKFWVNGPTNKDDAWMIEGAKIINQDHQIMTLLELESDLSHAAVFKVDYDLLKAQLTEKHAQERQA